MFNRVISAILLMIWMTTITSMIDYAEMAPTYTQWFISFSLPLWSIAAIGFWHDIGRELWNSYLLDEHSSPAMSIRWIMFTTWMSLFLSYIVVMYVSLHMIPLLLLLPVFTFVFRNFLISKWDTHVKANKLQLTTIFVWSLSSYLVSSILNIGLILLEVWMTTTFN